MPAKCAARDSIFQKQRRDAVRAIAVALSVLFVCAGLLSYLADPADLVSTEAAAAAGPVPATKVAYATKFLNEMKAETDERRIATQYYHSRNSYLGRVYAGRVTLNGS